ncbi:hypothetical protein NOR51B_1474 [Luminiphilus syltensis NOR5-1B]|uniref:Uncharacterized protein n=1 Tax=Luminiphilus syltensis NOR5-1B TaxID=565045 RepID=B8KY48_9GAMM|nr:hypothetical protein NOR51B_1474 [Luminiphilus syltensis NOR5-1B]
MWASPCFITLRDSNIFRGESDVLSSTIKMGFDISHALNANVARIPRK